MSDSLRRREGAADHEERRQVRAEADATPKMTPARFQNSKSSTVSRWRIVSHIQNTRNPVAKSSFGAVPPTIRSRTCVVHTTWIARGDQKSGEP